MQSQMQATSTGLIANTNTGGVRVLCVLPCCCPADLQLVLVNSSILYFNPSDTDNCEAYTQKRIFAFRQVGAVR